jgi:hypothetical protein
MQLCSFGGNSILLLLSFWHAVLTAFVLVVGEKFLFVSIVNVAEEMCRMQPEIFILIL